MSICEAGINWEVYFLCHFLLCPFPIDRSVEFALSNYSLSSFSLICPYQIGHHVVVQYVAANCAVFEFCRASRQYALFRLAVQRILPFSSSPLVSNLDVTDVSEHLT